jgi:uncharacterized sulfatase
MVQEAPAGKEAVESDSPEIPPMRLESVRRLARRGLALLVSLFGVAPASPGAEAGKVVDRSSANVLFIAVDDLGNVLGRNRPAGLDTPNLDRLAERGVRFERAYCQVPLCNPSRASVMTGRRPDSTTVWDLNRHFRERLPDVATLPQAFRQRGHFVARVGKIYHYDVPRGIGTSGLDDAPSWDRVVNPRGRDVLDESRIINPTPEKPISAALSWLAADGLDEEQTDGLVATEAIRLIEARPDRPFFLGVGFFRPHTPFVAPKRHFDRIPLDGVRLVEVPEGDRDDIPAAAIPHNIPQPDYGLSREVLRQALQAYYASVRFVDAQIGRLLDALERANLADRTIVVVWSDHGYHLGEHGLWQKRTLFEESAKTPLIVSAPGTRGRGRSCSRVVELVDLYPTLLDLVFGSVPEELDGRSLRPLLDDPERAWDHEAFTQILRPGSESPVMGRAITTERWRYIEWNAGRAGRELYDHAGDPRELTNLADDEAHQTTVERLRARLQSEVRGTPPTTPFDRSRL